MTLSQQIRELCDACFTGLLVRTSEDTEAIAELKTLAATEGWNFLVWDAATGLNGDGNGDPLAVVQALPAIGTADKAGMIVLRNFHRFLSDPQIIQAMANAVVAGKLTRSFAVITTPFLLFSRIHSGLIVLNYYIHYLCLFVLIKLNSLII